MRGECDWRSVREADAGMRARVAVMRERSLGAVPFRPRVRLAALWTGAWVASLDACCAAARDRMEESSVAPATRGSARATLRSPALPLRFRRPCVRAGARGTRSDWIALRRCDLTCERDTHDRNHRAALRRPVEANREARAAGTGSDRSAGPIFEQVYITHAPTL